MKKSIAKKWVAALRSGDYKQGKGQLRDTKNRFCCLGVLCNLHAQAHPKIAAMQRDKDAYMASTGLLPQEVMDWAGMSDEIGCLPNGDSLAELNDGGKRFTTIAKIIEQNVDAL